ncbi:MAG: glycosyltransferase family 2 protein [Calditrichaceae bacterium]|nr:glycosyltransferase family 2 protein [Calditrichaceae bacterium]MBN2709195.1 glycosyltransferase family 2 protein [Calditrichaceae bacterium]RQV96151.1 MAG: glycosyltransferase family 2 protein [Calditrichota bacterium]
MEQKSIENTKILISIVIPHFNGLEILRDCLNALNQNSFKAFQTIIIDNGSTDGSQDLIRKQFPGTRLIQNEENRGYAGACNQGIKIAQTPFVLLLNNDTVMPENFLQEMYNCIIADDKIAMVQPKILSIQNKHLFDYSGGAGGELDVFGYPFARGRIFELVEEDTGQYDHMENKVFWTSGCALLLRKSVTDVIGLLDLDFFAHQEEIDLNWRAQLCGFKCLATMNTYIYHYSGYTLRSHNEYKMYLNHRNNLIMMLKNYALHNLLIYFPVRILMEISTVLADFILWEGKRAKAALKSLFFIMTHPLLIYKKRRVIQRLRKVKDRDIKKNMYRRSVVIDYFIKKKKPLECIRNFRSLI